MNLNPRATLWLCSYAGPTAETHMALLQEILSWGNNLSYRGRHSVANIDRGRSEVASSFLRTPAEDAGDVLLMVDSDNAWRTGDLAFIAKRALESNAVIGGIYPKKAFGRGAAMRVTDGAENRSYAIGTDGLIPAEFVGTGFIAIPRAILATVAGTLPLCKGDFWPFFMPFVIEARGNEYPTDDQSFCWRVIEAGFKVYASTYPHVTHVGAYEFRMADSAVHPPPDTDMVLEFGDKPTNAERREGAHA